MSTVEGGCMCGYIRYTWEGDAALVAVCHCKTCQRQTGTSYSVLAAYPRENVRFTGGEPLAYMHQGDSGGDVARLFCGRCGSPILSDLASIPQLLFVKAGTLDDASWLLPTHHFFCDSKQPWVTVGRDVVTAARGI